MTIFVISYDLLKQKDYTRLIDRLKELGAHRPLESFWLADLNNTAKEVHDHLRDYLDADDRLWVSELTKKYHYSQAKKGTNDWLKAHPPER